VDSNKNLEPRMNTDKEVDCTLCMRHETTHTSVRRSFQWPSRRPPTAGNPAFLDTLVLFAKKYAWHSPGANLCLSVFICVYPWFQFTSFQRVVLVHWWHLGRFRNVFPEGGNCDDGCL
jgi:hypothetical protein